MVTDVNDNAPVIEPKEMKVVIKEVTLVNYEGNPPSWL